MRNRQASRQRERQIEAKKAARTNTQRAQTHARTDARTHARTHACTNAAAPTVMHAVWVGAERGAEGEQRGVWGGRRRAVRAANGVEEVDNTMQEPFQRSRWAVEQQAGAASKASPPRVQLQVQGRGEEGAGQRIQAECAHTTPPPVRLSSPRSTSKS